MQDGSAQINARVDLALAGRSLHLELPPMEMAATELRGQRGFEIRLPLLRRRF